MPWWIDCVIGEMLGLCDLPQMPNGALDRDDSDSSSFTLNIRFGRLLTSGQLNLLLLTLDALRQRHCTCGQVLSRIIESKYQCSITPQVRCLVCARAKAKRASSSYFLLLTYSEPLLMLSRSSMIMRRAADSECIRLGPSRMQELVPHGLRH